MPVYRVYLDGQDTGNFVTGSTYADAYFNVASTVPLTYENDVQLKEIDSKTGPH
ncbi:Hypothetical protein LUCI_1731 [Lucifera butyrica]|uniref:Uncharacterized protein n=1 Tax=Lucifera butyrica TaxID=1351585 RepID=A0A498RBI5_9FIRM|nr:hypothetical protein [Lucifera butyrica]VBB06498.1 Hypothetical protein LUCI_1731 [Lucifera butyrica]